MISRSFLAGQLKHTVAVIGICPCLIHVVRQGGTPCSLAAVTFRTQSFFCQSSSSRIRARIGSLRGLIGRSHQSTDRRHGCALGGGMSRYAQQVTVILFAWMWSLCERQPLGIYCGYARGLVAFVFEIVVRTEQYFFPTKRARRIHGPPTRHRRFWIMARRRTTLPGSKRFALPQQASLKQEAIWR